MIKIISSLIKKFHSASGKPRELLSFYDRDTATLGVGALPRSLRFEAAALIKDRTQGKVLDAVYLQSLPIAEGGRICVEEVLTHFLRLAQSFANNKPSPYKPWRIGLFIYPDTEFNASIKISDEPRQNTIFIFFNVGVILQLCNRFNSLLCNNEFLPKFAHNVEPSVASNSSMWLANVPTCITRQKLATHLALFGSMNVLFHELAHFYRGHLTYLRNSEWALSELFEVEGFTEVSSLPFNERRLLELDADQFAGKLASNFWRQANHPTVGPKEDANENFYMLFVVAALITFLMMDDTIKTARYYSPLWRLHQFMDYFDKDHFALEPGETKESAQGKLLDLIMSIHAHIESSSEKVGLNGEFSYERFDIETATLLGDDAKRYAEMAEKIAPFRPDTYSFS
jgi:hypothetical protein